MPFGTALAGLVTSNAPTGWLVAVVAQTGTDVDVIVGNPATNVLGSAVGAFVTTLVVGAILVAVAPEYLRRQMDAVLENPIGNFFYGLVSLLFVVLVIIVLVITFVGIILAIPFALAAYLAWAVGSSVAFLAIADRLLGHDEGWTIPLLAAAGANGLLALTGVGGLLSFCIGAAGFGTVLREYL